MSEGQKKKKVVAVKEAQYEVGFLYNAPPGFAPDGSIEQKIVNPVPKESGMEEKKNYKQALEEQKLTQYPFLANAPLEGAYVSLQDHSLNPVGVVLRNVKCAKCGLYGHRSNEKACPMLGVMSEAEKWHAQVEDPLVKLKGGLQGEDKFALRSIEDSVIGGLKKDDPNLQLVESDKDSSSDSSDSEAEDLHKSFLASLSKSQMKALLKEYKRAAKKKKKKENKKESKRKHKKHDKSERSGGREKEKDSHRGESEKSKRHKVG